MTSIIHFRFRNALQGDVVRFDGQDVSLLELKALIAAKKGFHNSTELLIKYDLTGDEIAEADARISRNASVVVQRKHVHMIYNRAKAILHDNKTSTPPTTHRPCAPSLPMPPPSFHHSSCLPPNQSRAECDSFKTVHRSSLPIRAVRTFKPQFAKQTDMEFPTDGCVPPDLHCALTHRLLADAVMLPCCKSKVCAEEVGPLLDSSETCPLCFQFGVHASMLLPLPDVRARARHFHAACADRNLTGQEHTVASAMRGVTHEDASSDDDKMPAGSAPANGRWWDSAPHVWWVLPPAPRPRTGRTEPSEGYGSELTGHGKRQGEDLHRRRTKKARTHTQHAQRSAGWNKKKAW